MSAIIAAVKKVAGAIKKSAGKEGEYALQRNLNLANAGMSTGSFIEPLTDLIRYNLFKIWQSKILDPSTLAALRQRDLINETAYFHWCKLNGLHKDRASELYSLQKMVLPWQVLISLRWRGVLTDEQVSTRMKWLGVREPDQDRLVKVLRPRLAPAELFTAFIRRIIDRDEYESRMKKLGWREEQVKEIEKSSYFEPSPSDLILQAVREIFTPDIRKAFKLDSEYPEILTARGRRIGIRETHMKDFWASHWSLPPITAAYMAYHRGYITDEMLDKLMKAHDIMPGFRKMMKDLATQPYTRIDARRMYRRGVISDDELMENYRWLGYNEERAKKMLEWEQAGEIESPDRDLTKGEILDLLEYSLISESEAIEELKDAGFDQQESGKLVKLQVRKLEHKKQKEQAETLVNKYVFNKITESEVTTGLNALGLPPDSVEYFQIKAVEKKDRRSKLPSKADILDWYKHGEINMVKAEEYLKLIGYADEFVALYIKKSKRVGRPSKR